MKSNQNDRVRRDAAGVGPYARDRDHLVPMSSLASWTVAAGEPDVRGWDVRTVSGRQLGTVGDMLVDQSAGEVVMLDVDLPGTERHTVVPIRLAEIDRVRRVVLMDSADFPEAVAAPVHHEVVVDRQPVVERAADSALPVEDADANPPEAAADADIPDADRRRGERRRIDRMNTEL